jgi:hypothetical protein
MIFAFGKAPKIALRYPAVPPILMQAVQYLAKLRYYIPVDIILKEVITYLTAEVISCPQMIPIRMELDMKIESCVHIRL